MPELTDEGKRLVADIAGRHGTSPAAAAELLAALDAGGGTQAQFDIPELGGMGQWSSGGMVMVGDMFNNALRAKVDALGRDLAALLRSGQPFKPEARGGRGGREWWPAGLGRAASVGAQNDTRYAFFPETRRLAVEEGGRLTVYDTGDHRLSGFGQQQPGRGAMRFTSQHGDVRLADLPVVDQPREPIAESGQPADTPRPGPARPPAPAPGDEDVLAKLERLAELRDRGIVTESEFAEKKAELLRRL